MTFHFKKAFNVYSLEEIAREFEPSLDGSRLFINYQNPVWKGRVNLMYKRRNESQWICCEMYKGEESSSEDVGWFHSKSIHTKKSYFPIYFFFCNSENERDENDYMVCEPGICIVSEGHLELREDDTRLILATEIKENIEIVYTKKYSQFLQTLLPHFVRILSTEEPVFELGDSQKLRLTLLEIINRLPNNEFFHPYYEIILKLTMSLLAKENEENALVCLRIILELHKYYRSNMSAELGQLLQAEAKNYLQFVHTAYTNLPQTGLL
jgi:hypothetical protein